MCMGGKPKAVKVAQAPEEQDAAVVAARDDERKRRIASASVVGFNLGSLNSAAWEGYFDDPQLEEARTTYIGPYVEVTPLATPTWTLSGRTPASPGNSDGTATVEMPGGDLARVRNPLGAQAGQGVYVQDGAVIGDAPALPYVLIEI